MIDWLIVKYIATLDDHLDAAHDDLEAWREQSRKAERRRVSSHLLGLPVVVQVPDTGRFLVLNVDLGGKYQVQSWLRKNNEGTTNQVL